MLWRLLEARVLLPTALGNQRIEGNMPSGFSPPTCSKCNQVIVFTDAAKKCSNPACGRVVCLVCAATSVNFCWICSNPLTALTLRPSAGVSQSSSALDVSSAIAQHSLQESQKRLEASQLRIERDAQEANRKKVELEKERLELEKARANEDNRQRQEVAAFRSLASLTVAFTEKVLASLP